MSTNPQVQTPPTAFELLSQFTYHRQNGLNRDDAWYKVCDDAQDVNEVTIKAFLNLAKNWERQEGHKYTYRSQEKTESTQSGRDVPVVKKESIAAAQPQPQAQVEQTKPVTPRPNGNAALTGALDPAKLREYEQKQLEDILDQLDELPDEDKSPQSQAAPMGRTAPIGYKPDYFGPRTVLLMIFKNYREPLRVTVAGEAEMFIGRTTSNTAMAPDVDLNTVGAANYGVSRMHAAITRRNNQLLIADLQSMNCTYVNGVRLLANEVRVVQDGDEIWFGQLPCKIRFQHL